MNESYVADAPQSSWLTEIWTTLAAASGVGYLAASYTVSRWLTRPSPDQPQEWLAQARLSQADLSDQQLRWDELECQTADGVRLAGWVVSPAEPRGTVALFHGFRGHRGHMLSRIAFLTGAGYRCVAFDHRGHGQSGGRRISFGFFEGRDVTTVLDLVRRNWPGQPHAAIGISMGAAALCFAAEHVNSCQAVILESLYHDLASAFTNRVGNNYPAWFHRFSRGVIWVTERRLGVRLPHLAPSLHVHKLAPAPILFLTGSADLHAPPWDVEKLYARCEEPREFYVVPGATHDDVCEKGGPFYQNLILDFLSRKLLCCPDSPCLAPR